MLVYSIEEKNIGTWIDGKPIYRRTISGTMNSEGYNRVDIISWSMDRLLNAYGSYNTIYGHQVIIGSEMDSINYTTGIYVDPIANPTILTVSGGSYYHDCQYYVTIEYTKTTD